MAISEPAAGQSFGPYRLLRELWFEALGTRSVAAAPDGTPVSLLQIAHDGLGDAELWRISDAIDAVHALRDPHVIGVLEMVEADEGLGLLSVITEGISLRTLMRLQALRPEPLDIALTLRILLDLIDGVNAAHDGWAERARAGPSTVHGGVTPDAALVCVSGVTQLLDAGLQGLLSELTGRWRHPELLAYRAPEQLDLDPSADARTAVFGCGALLWELVTNRALFGASVARAATVRPPPVAARHTLSGKLEAVGWLGEDVDAVHTRQNVIERIVGATVPRLDEVSARLRISVSASLADVVDIALARDPDERFASPILLADAIWSLGEPIASRMEVAEALERLAGALIAERYGGLHESGGSGAG